MEINAKRERQSFPVEGAARKQNAFMERILVRQIVRHLGSLAQALPLIVQPRLSPLLSQSLDLIIWKNEIIIQLSYVQDPTHVWVFKYKEELAGKEAWTERERV